MRDLVFTAIAACAVLLPAVCAAAEPPLPAGLGTESVPAREPSPASTHSANAPALVGFWDTRLGVRLQNDELVDDDLTLAESRVRLEYERHEKGVEFVLKSDLLFDALVDDRGIDIGRREGWMQLREFKLGVRPHPKTDLAFGRQVLTWGTGDLVFINDLFPKDFNSFFIGRAEEYLKSPVDGVRLSASPGPLNFDLVYSPRFDSDLYLDAERLSFFGSPGSAGPRVQLPDGAFADDEWHLRVHKRLGSWEFAAYGYDGFWKGPQGFDLDQQVYLFPRLSVYGGSVRGPGAGGILNAEYGYYDSKDAGLKGSRYAPPSEQQLLLGYQRELARELSLGLQYYLTKIVDYGSYQAERLAELPDRDRYRHVLTARLTQLLMAQDLRLSLFAFVSPSDEDGYLRPQLHYRFDDRFSLDLGANIFFGRSRDSFFGQLEDNTNIYSGIRYTF
jgi:hypothetical protein